MAIPVAQGIDRRARRAIASRSAGGRGSAQAGAAHAVPTLSRASLIHRNCSNRSAECRPSSGGLRRSWTRRTALRAKRRAALAQLDTLIFCELYRELAPSLNQRIATPTSRFRRSRDRKRGRTVQLLDLQGSPGRRDCNAGAACCNPEAKPLEPGSTRAGNFTIRPTTGMQRSRASPPECADRNSTSRRGVCSRTDRGTRSDAVPRHDPPCLRP